MESYIPGWVDEETIHLKVLSEEMEIAGNIIAVGIHFINIQIIFPIPITVRVNSKGVIKLRSSCLKRKGLIFDANSKFFKRKWRTSHRIITNHLQLNY